MILALAVLGLSVPSKGPATTAAALGGCGTGGVESSKGTF